VIENFSLTAPHRALFVTPRPDTAPMTKQLTLIDTQPNWRLDEKTRRVGRRGIAEARAALAAGRRSRSSGPPDDGPHTGRTSPRRPRRGASGSGTRSAA
jgi:hypothetical protein